MDTSRAEAERLLGVASKLLHNRDLSGSREFAILAQETEPLLEGSDQILTIVEVLLASEKRINNHPDWYSVLQLPPKTHDSETIKKQYRRLALLLHPDKNKFAFAESAFHLVADAWGVLSDPGKKSGFDVELGDLGLNFSRVDLEESRKRKEKDAHYMQNQSQSQNQESAREKFPVRRSTEAAPASGGGGFGFSMKSRKRGRPKGSFGKGKGSSSNGVNSGAGVAVGARAKAVNFWTGCPYCYNLYEYPKMYEGFCMRCVKCKKGFTAEGVGYEPPKVPGKEEYYCCWGMFPMGFNDGGGGGARGFEAWMPGMQNGGKGNVGVGRGRGRGRGRPRKVKEVRVPVGVPLASANVNGSGTVSPVPVTMVSGDVAGSVSPVTVASASVNAAASVTPWSTSVAPKKRGRGRPRKNPLP